MLVINGVGGAPLFNVIQMLGYGVCVCLDGRAYQSGVLGQISFIAKFTQG